MAKLLNCLVGNLISQRRESLRDWDTAESTGDESSGDESKRDGSWGIKALRVRGVGTRALRMMTQWGSGLCPEAAYLVEEVGSVVCVIWGVEGETGEAVGGMKGRAVLK